MRVLYHGAASPVAHSFFLPLSHFGSEEAARRSAGNSLERDDGGPMRLYTCRLWIANPLEIEDREQGHGVIELADLMERSGVLSSAVLDRVLAPIRTQTANRSLAIRYTELDLGQSIEDAPYLAGIWEAKLRLIDQLIARGYDGFIYTNRVEHEGSTCLVNFQPDQVEILDSIVIE